MTVDYAPPPPGAMPLDTAAPPRAGVFASALALMACGDWLFWNHRAGVSLAIFALLVAAAFFAVSFPMPNRRRAVQAIGILALAILPVVELVQPLSVLFLVAGLIVFALLSAERLPPDPRQTAQSVAGFPVIGMAWFFLDLTATATRLGPAARIRRGAVSAWIMPAALGLVFLALFTAANPVIETWAEAVLEIDLKIDEPERILFWIAVSLGVWPFLRLTARAWPLGRDRSSEPAAAPEAREPRGMSLINPDSVRNALILFNGMFAVQTALDAAYLWGGAALPDGMTYATYAHRGAYPLVATAIMASAFVIGVTSVMRPGPLMRWLIFLWVGQNILLLFSSVLRLNLYVSVYALTHLRVAAFIWMGLLAAGFVLILVRLAYDKSNRWLVIWNGAMGMGVLYLCCFVNFADVIARYNLSHSQLVNGQWAALDGRYICELGPHALPAIDEFEASTGLTLCGGPGQYHRPRYHARDSWRAWGFRDWRLERTLAAQSAAIRPAEWD